jgi:hypothetical protein
MMKNRKSVAILKRTKLIDATLMRDTSKTVRSIDRCTKKCAQANASDVENAQELFMKCSLIHAAMILAVLVDTNESSS